MTENMISKLGNHNVIDDTGQEINFKSLLEQAAYTILFFYPKDNTGGCTIENQEFEQLKDEFKALGAQLIGVSADSVKSHQKFKEKFDFEHMLISDEDKILCEAFDVWVEKKMYGKTHWGIKRATWILDKKGDILFEWPKAPSKQHAQDVLDKLTEIQN